MAMAIKQKVLGLQIPVDDVPRVEILECQRDFCGVELGYWVWEALQPGKSVRTTKKN